MFLSLPVEVDCSDGAAVGITLKSNPPSAACTKKKYQKITSWIKMDLIGSYWIKLHHIGSDWIKLDQIRSNRIKLDKIDMVFKT